MTIASMTIKLYFIQKRTSFIITSKIPKFLRDQFNLNPQISIRPPAIPPDLASRSSQRANISHLNHRSREIRSKRSLVTAVATNNRIGRPGAGEQLLIGVEQSAVADEVGVWKSSGARLLSPVPFCLGQLDCRVRAKDPSMLFSL
ncbi:hypothetical protein LINPERPRIM_LOCUS41679 [Linum perenne]